MPTGLEFEPVPPPSRSSDSGSAAPPSRWSDPDVDAGSDAAGRDSDVDICDRDTAGRPAVAPDASTADRVARLRRISRLLDSAVAIPGTNRRVGLDPLVGLVPVVGDAPTTAAAVYIVAEAAAIGAPRATIARMCLNLLVDAVVGSIPLVGDAFDALWHANDRNVRLLEARLQEPTGERRDRRAVTAFGAVVFVTVLFVGAGAAAAVWWLLGVSGVV
ncbi:DUF4112 domain-containing protein [Halobellus sp. Atlit-31R]|nr:DUF4112 domain-containing protein [Halobellus sp. Atlit-31R]